MGGRCGWSMSTRRWRQGGAARASWKRSGAVGAASLCALSCKPVVEQIRHCKGQLDRLTREIEALVAEEKIPMLTGPSCPASPGART